MEMLRKEGVLIHEELDVLIIDGGFGGLLAAARLQKVGITNIRIIEKAGDFGGA
jgi:cyclohexanone monooxygenase